MTLQSFISFHYGVLYMRNLRCIVGASDKPVEGEWKLAVSQGEEGFLLFCFVLFLTVKMLLFLRSNVKNSSAYYSFSLIYISVYVPVLYRGQYF